MAKWEDIRAAETIFRYRPPANTPRAHWLGAIHGGLLALAAELRGANLIRKPTNCRHRMTAKSRLTRSLQRRGIPLFARSGRLESTLSGHSRSDGGRRRPVALGIAKDITTASANLSLLAYDREHLFERRG